MKSVLSILAIASLALACGGDDGGGGFGDPIDDPTAQAAADQSVDSTLELDSLADDPGNDSSIGNLNGVFGSLSTVLNAKIQAQGAPTSASLIATSNITGDCLTQSSGGGAIYNNCDFGTGTIDGSITVTGDTIDVDLTITTDANGQSTTVDMDGSITITATALTGDLSYTVTSSASGQNFTYDIDATYDITLTDGCATGGEMIVDGSWEVQGIPGSAQSAKVKATFGPACGDVVLT